MCGSGGGTACGCVTDPLGDGDGLGERAGSAVADGVGLADGLEASLVVGLASTAAPSVDPEGEGLGSVDAAGDGVAEAAAGLESVADGSALDPVVEAAGPSDGSTVPGAGVIVPSSARTGPAPGSAIEVV